MADGDPKRPERLANAPIVEAIIDIHVESSLPRLEDLGPFDELARGEFPERKRVVEWQGNVDLSDDKPKITSPSADVKGYAFWASDKRRVMQVRLNGFSLRRQSTKRASPLRKFPSFSTSTFLRRSVFRLTGTSSGRDWRTCAKSRTMYSSTV